jgi:WxL domain surface cell wall-binding
MHTFLHTRVTRVAASLAVVSAFAVAPMTALAANTDATGTLAAGSLTNVAPVIAPFNATLTGLTQTVDTKVGASSVTDATGSGAGYSITVAASAPTVGGVPAAAGTGSTLTLTPVAPTAAAGNPAATGPVATAGAQALSAVATTVANAAVGTGQGKWDFAADAGAVSSLAVVIPGDARAGAYSSTLTYTTAPPAA